MKDLPDSVPSHLQMPHDTYYSGFMFYFYSDIQIQLDDLLAHDNVFYNMFFF